MFISWSKIDQWLISISQDSLSYQITKDVEDWTCQIIKICEWSLNNV